MNSEQCILPASGFWHLASIRFLLAPGLWLLACSFPLGCGAPNHANIELRKRIQTLEAQNAALQEQAQSQRRMIASLQSAHPTTQHLGPDELKKLYVTYGVKFARLTGGADLNPSLPGDEGLRVYLTPTDEQGETIQAAGSVVIEAFDLDLPDKSRIGRWEFATSETRKHWQSLLLEAAYVLTCPWQQTPQHANLTLRATFTDELTGASFTAQRPVTVHLPSAQRTD